VPVGMSRRWFGTGTLSCPGLMNTTCEPLPARSAHPSRRNRLITSRGVNFGPLSCRHHNTPQARLALQEAAIRRWSIMSLFSSTRLKFSAVLMGLETEHEQFISATNIRRYIGCAPRASQSPIISMPLTGTNIGSRSNHDRKSGWRKPRQPRNSASAERATHHSARRTWPKRRKDQGP
jgi:hypothetical protein